MTRRTRSGRSTTLLATLLLAASAGAPALAMAAGSAAAPRACDPEKAECPDEFRESVVVTATRTPVRRDRIGSTIDVIAVESAVPLAGGLVTDLLSRVPGVDVRRTGGPGSEASIFLRGADSDHTLVLVDGLEVNDPSTPARTAFATHLDVDGIERIEVLRGPQSTVWGSDAIGGVVNVVTRESGPARVRLWSEAGSHSTAAGGVGWSDRLGDARVSLSASRVETSGISQSDAGSEKDPYDRTSVTGRVRVPIGERVDLDASVRRIAADTAFDGFLVEAGHEIEAGQTLASAAATVRTGGRVTHRVSVRRADHERVTSGSFPSDISGRQTAAGWIGTVEAGRAHTLTLGTEIEDERADFRTFTASARTASAFLEDRVNVARASGRWSGSLGARLDDHERFGARTTMRASGAWQRSEDAPLVRASLGTGFKAPSIAELDPRAFAGNASLEPETSLGADLGIEWPLARGAATLTATGFVNRFDDLIVAVFDPGTFSFMNVNVDEARSHGLELGVRAALTPRTGLTASWTWTETEAVGSPAGFGLADGEPLLRRPRYKGSIGVDARFGPAAGRGAGRVAIDVRHVGSRRDLDPLTFLAVDAPAHTVAHASLRFGVSGIVAFTARVENLTDEEYQDVLGFGTAGRSLYAGLSVEIPLD